VPVLAEAAIAHPPTYNPIVLCGPSGVGKTALAHALAGLRARQQPACSVVGHAGVDLARALAHAIETDATADFRGRHHRCDLLLVDDVEQLAEKPAAQQFLLSTIDALLHRGALVIVTAKSVRGLLADSGLLPGLVSRLAGGLVVTLAPPGPLARQALIRQLAAQANLPLDDASVATLAGAGRSRSALTTPRQLRHAVLQLAAEAEVTQSPVPAERVARLVAASQPQARAVCRRVTQAVARHFGLAVSELKGKSRLRTVVEARSLAMYLTRRLTGASYAEIGRYFTGRNHTTVLHACRKIATLVEDDEPTRQRIEALAAELNELPLPELQDSSPASPL
jgi:chromosomal replication initiator protein